MSFGDGIDWDNEARRQSTSSMEEHARGGVRANALEIVRHLRNAGAAGRLLDCGCNIGRYCPPLREAGFEYVGVDQSDVALQVCRDRYPGVDFVRTFLWDMPFEAAFDVAISMAVLQHNQLAEKRRILPRIAAAVRPGGFFAMQESTVIAETATQLRHDQWVELVESFGFKLRSTWHPNPEYSVHDAYLFQRSK